MSTKIERWFTRARADRKFKKFNLAISPHLAETFADNGTNRVAQIMKLFSFQINVIRDTTIQTQEFRVYSAETNEDITDKYKV
jgi:hypothetical protein